MNKSNNLSLNEHCADGDVHSPNKEEMIQRVLQEQAAAKKETEFTEKEGCYYRYRDNFERQQNFPGLRLFDTLQEAYQYLQEDGKGATLFQCDGVAMERDDMPPPLNWLKRVIDEMGVVEIQIGFKDKPGKDIWILEKEGRKEDYHQSFPMPEN